MGAAQGFSSRQPGCLVQSSVDRRLHGVATPSQWSRQLQPSWSTQDSEPWNRSHDQAKPLQFMLLELHTQPSCEMHE
jgi:hypothetical protein